MLYLPGGEGPTARDFDDHQCDDDNDDDAHGDPGEQPGGATSSRGGFSGAGDFLGAGRCFDAAGFATLLLIDLRPLKR